MSNTDTRLCKFSVATLRKGVTKFRKRINALPVKGFLELHAADKDVRGMMESASGWLRETSIWILRTGFT